MKKTTVIFVCFIATCLFLVACKTSTSQDNKEVVELYNERNGETIYLIKIAWGLDDDRMAIGLDKELKAGTKYEHPEKYNSCCGATPFFYKFSNDTLIVINGGFEKPKENNFITPVKIVEMEGYYFRELCKNDKYKELGYKVFPESQIYIIQNSGK